VALGAPLLLSIAACSEAPRDRAPAEIAASTGEPVRADRTPAAQASAPTATARPRDEGPPRLLARRELRLAGQPSGLERGDVDGDGAPDLAVVLDHPGRLYLWSAATGGLQGPAAVLECGDFALGPVMLPEGRIGLAPRADGTVLLVHTVAGALLPTRRELPSPARVLDRGDLDRDGVDELLWIDAEGQLGVWRGADPEAPVPLEVGRATCLRVGSHDGTLWVGVQLPPTLLGFAPADLRGSAPARASRRIELDGVPRALREVDLDGDGAEELLCAGGDEQLWILDPRAADPGASLRRVRTPGLVPLALRAADLDRDGRPELVTVQSYDTSYGVLGRFDREYGRFAFARSEYAGQAPVALELFDFDGDALLDLVVANRDAQCLSLLPGSGLAKDDKSSFYAAQRLPSGNNPLSVAAGDLDGDGVPDAALANGSAGTVTVFLNRFGLLGERRDLEVGPSPTAVRIADLDGDGHEDLLVLLRPAGGARLAVLHGRGGGEFEAVRSVELGSDVAQLAAVDLQGDGGADWVAVDPLGGRLLVLDVPRPAAAGFVPEPRILAQVPRPAAVTAVIGAGGRQELAVAQDDGRPGVVLYRLQGEALVEVLRAPAEGAAVDLTSGDFDGDGRADLALLARRAAGEPNGFVQLYLRREAGLEPGAREEVGLAAAELVAGDVDGDGRDDLLVAAQNSHQLNLFLLREGGRPERQLDLGAGLGCLGVALADLNADGRLDVLSANAFSHDLSVIYNLPGQ
jgi:hypothetical protein